MSCHDDANFMQNYENKQFIQIVSEKWLMLLAKKIIILRQIVAIKLKLKIQLGN